MFPAYNQASLLTVMSWSFFTYNWSFFACSCSLFAYSGSVCVSEPLTRSADCKQGSSTLVVRIARPASLAIWHRGRSHRRPSRSESPNRRHFVSLMGLRIASEKLFASLVIWGCVIRIASHIAVASRDLGHWELNCKQQSSGCKQKTSPSKIFGKGRMLLVSPNSGRYLESLFLSKNRASLKRRTP